MQAGAGGSSTMKKDGSSQVRRQLDFREKVFTEKTFYIDIREEDLKKRISRRIHELGGQVEGFLSKDVHIMVTDSNNTTNNETRVASPSPTLLNNKVPLSRGKALLLKATKSSSQQLVKGTDIVQNALNLGVKVEKAVNFLKATHKYVQRLRQAKITHAAHSDGIDGITPLQWQNCDKENLNILKVEDERQMYRPFLKHFEGRFPQVRYNEDLVSPFDKGVVLCRTTEKQTKNRYSTKAKTSVTMGRRGGFCEACDYWYRCLLREHLNSMKHQKFVQTAKNFQQLDQIITKMPSLKDFMSKFKLDINKSNEGKSNNLISDGNIVDSNCTVGEDSSNMGVDHHDHGTPMSASASPVSAVVSCDKESVSSACAMVISPGPADPHPVIANCDTDILMDVSMASKDTFDECSKDSGTGPEIQEDISVPFDFVPNIGHALEMRVDISVPNVCITSNNDGVAHILDEDSAIQQDQTSRSDVSTSCVIPSSNSSYHANLTLRHRHFSIGDDNAVFLDLPIRGNNTNIPVQEATSNVRRKLSAIAITDTKGSSIQSVENKENMIDAQEPSSFCFAGFEDSLPLNSLVTLSLLSSHDRMSSVSGVEMDFANIAAGWMKDISKSTSKDNVRDMQEHSTKKKKMSSTRTRKDLSVLKRKNSVSVKKSRLGDNLRQPLTPIDTNQQRGSSESDIELPQLPVLNSNVARQRLIEAERRLQSSPIQYCSRVVQDQRATSTCTKSRVKLFGRRCAESIRIKRLRHSPMSQSQEGSCNFQTKMPQFFSDKVFPSLMALDSVSQLVVCGQQTPINNNAVLCSPMRSDQQETGATGSSHMDQNIQPSHIPYPNSYTPCHPSSSQCVSQSSEHDHKIPGTPTPSEMMNSENFRTPKCQEFDEDATEEYCNSCNDQDPLHCNSDTEDYEPYANVTLTCGNLDEGFNAVVPPIQLDSNSDTEEYVPFSPKCPVSEQNEASMSVLSSINECGIKTKGELVNSFGTNCVEMSKFGDKVNTEMSQVITSMAKPELSFSVDSILSGQTGRNLTSCVNTTEHFESTSQLSPEIDVVGLVEDSKELLDMKSTDVKQRKRKRHPSKKHKPAGFEYHAYPQGGIKIKLCRVRITPAEQKYNLKTFWKVTKAGSCRLVFSAEKEKGIGDVISAVSNSNSRPNSKRRKLVY